MFDVEKEVDNLINEKEYDERLTPFIKAFFLYNAKQGFWNEKYLQEKIKLYKERIDGIQFVDLDNKKALIDYDSKLLLINENALQSGKYQDVIELVSEVFSEQEIITKDTEHMRFWKQTGFYSIENLKYSTNKENKENILKMISNGFDRKPEEFYELRDILDKEIDNTKDDKEKNEYLEICNNTIFPGIEQAVKDIMSDNKTDAERKNAYISLYSASLLSLQLRLENSKEDKTLIKEQYNNLNKEFYKIAENYIVMAGELQECKVSNNWTIKTEEIDGKLREKLKDVEPNNEFNKNLIIDDFKQGVNKEYITQISLSCKPKNIPANMEYVNRQAEKLGTIYGEKFGPIVKEYIIRSAKVYNWTEDELNKKVTNYLNNIKKVKFVKEIPDSSISVAGKFSIKERTLYGKSDLALISSRNALGIYFHEQEHGTDETIRGDATIDNELEHVNINEYATEIGAINLLGDKIYDDKLCFTHAMEGYNELKYAGSMMSAALGISESKFAELRDKGNKKAIQYLKEKFNYMDVEYILEEFEYILTSIQDSPSMTYMQEKSGAYARMYNFSQVIMNTRLEQEKQNILPEEIEKFKLKSEYEKTKIAYNMKQAERKLFLKSKYIKPLVGDYRQISRDAKVLKEDRNKYLELVEELYPEKNVQFDNKEILKHVDMEFKHPIRGKIARLFKKNRVTLLPEGNTQVTVTSEGEARRQFTSRYAVENTPNIKNVQDVSKDSKVKAEEKTLDDN